MPRKEKIVFAVLVFIAIALWMVMGWDYFISTWQTPLGMQMALPELTSNPSDNAGQPETPTSQGLFFPQKTALPTIQPTATNLENPLCGGPTTLTILAIGSDTRAENYLYGLADVIRYVRIDFVHPNIKVLEFPRDLWVQIPEIEKHYGITHGKLNQAYFYGNPGMGYYEGPGQGPGLLARTMDLNFGAHPDQYIAANMHAFVRLVDTIGGIDITLPYSVDARKPDQQKRKDLLFEAGSHHLSGEQALMLGRIREKGVFARADQQNRILCGLRDAITSPYILPKIPDVIQSLQGAIQTDLSPQQLAQLVCLVPHLTPADITFTTFPRNLLTEGRTYDIGVKKDVFVFNADFETLKLFVKAFDLGAWPEKIQQGNNQPNNIPRGEGTFNCP
jgi:LCP family protein required for cell wall assembly